MISTVRTIAEQLEKEDDLHNAHGLIMNLVESILRHLATVAVAAYRASGCRDQGANKLIATELPWPSMGSWENFLAKLAATSPELLPTGFHGRFLAQLRETIGDVEIQKVCAGLENLLAKSDSHANTPSDGPNRVKCTALGFLGLVVRYRNEFEGHGPHTFTEPQREFCPQFRAGVLALCRHLRPLWLAYPVYVAETTSRAGATYHVLRPLVEDPSVEEVSIADEGVVAQRLYVRTDPKTGSVAELYPIAIWDGGEVLFLNGASNFRDIKYVGYVSDRQLKTHVHERAFCDFMLPFMGGSSLDVSDLDVMRGAAQAKQLEDAGWSFPDLKRIEIGPDEARYKLRKKIARGGMAEVWSAEDLDSHQPVALKFLLNLEHAARFRREARALREFSEETDRVVKFLGSHYDPHPNRRVFFMSMELLSERSLQNLAEDGASIPYDDVVNWLEDALRALRVLHEAGAIHRDVKPANLVQDDAGRVKLVDLGLVGIKDPAQASDLLTTIGLTVAGAAVGTYEFCSLEQLEGGKGGREVGPQSDLFSLGATMYYLLTGQLPYGSELPEIISRHKQAEEDEAAGPPPITKSRPDCPRMLNDLIMSLIEVRPESRPKSAGWVLRQVGELRQALEGKEVNYNFNLLGTSGDPGVKFEDLMPTWCSTYIFRFWLCVMLLQYALVIPLSYSDGTGVEIALGEFDLNPSAYVIHRPFWKDYMFLVWNTIPFLLIVLLYRARIRVQTLMKSIHSLDRERHGTHWASVAQLNNKFARLISSPFLYVTLLGLSSFACYIQLDKLSTLAGRGEIYWWDFKISMAAYVIRFIALFFDIAGVALLLIVVLAFVCVVWYTLRGTRLRIDPGHSDNACGLSDVGRLLSLFLPFLIVLMLNIVVGTVDHRGQDPKQVASDWVALAVCTVLYFMLLWWPMLPVRRQIRQFIATEVQRFSNRRWELEERMRRLVRVQGDLPVDKEPDFAALRRFCDELRVYEKQLSRCSTWPIRRRTAVRLALLGLLPPAIALVLLCILPPKGHWVSSVAYSPDGQYIASGSGDNTISVWDASSTQETITFKNGHTGYVSSVAFSPDGQRIASGSGDNTIKVWDVFSRKETRTLEHHTDVVYSVAFSRDGRYIASGSRDNTIKVWDVSGDEASPNREPETLKGHTDDVYSVAFSPDGQYIASGSRDNTIIVWDASSGQELHTLNGHKGYVSSVAYSPDGQRIASGSGDNTVRIWDASSGQTVETLSGHRDGVLSVAFSRGDGRLVSGSADGTILVWDVSDGEKTHTLTGHTGCVYCVAFSPDGLQIASGSSGHAIKVRDAQIDMSP